MKTLNETFTDQEYENLKRVKGNVPWHDFILTLTLEPEVVRCLLMSRQCELKEAKTE